MPTALDFITRSLRLINFIDVTETPEPEDAEEGLVLLNEFIEHLATQRQTVHVVGRHVQSLSDGVASYTIGSGGAWDQPRPTKIESWSVIPDGGASPVHEYARGRPLTTEEYQAIPIKSTQGSYPTALYYDYGWTGGLGTVSVYPVPNSSAPDVVLYVPTVLAAFADLTTNYTFPPGYARMIRFNFAKDLAVSKNKTLPAAVKIEATNSLAWIKRANHRPQPLRFDPAFTGFSGSGAGAYNIETDE